MNVGQATFSDNAGNRRLNRVGKPRDSVCMTAMYMAHVSLDTADASAVYVDNSCNFLRGRVRKPVGSWRMTGFGLQVDKVVKKLWANPGYDFDKEEDSDVAVTAADIFAREVAECTWRANYSCSSNVVLETNVESVLNHLPADKIVSSSEVELRDRIGSGGFGDVFLGRLRGDIVVVKKMRSLSSKGIKSFKNEVKSLVRLDHPNIVRFICACVEMPYPFIVMEYNGVSLWEALHVREVQMTDNVKADLAAQMWRGLEYLHRKNTAHGDVKSRNVLLANVNVNGQTGVIAKLSDFGLANIFGHAADKDGVYKIEGFSARYAAPEILRNELLTAGQLKAADVYSMGLVTFELAVEMEPFSIIRSREQLILKRRSGDVLPLLCAKECQYDYFYVLMNPCWNKLAEKRPTAKHVLTAIEKLVKDGTMEDAIASHRWVARNKMKSNIPESRDGGKINVCFRPYCELFSHEFFVSQSGHQAPAKSGNVYQDTALNRGLGRVGLPLKSRCPKPLEHYLVSALYSEPRPPYMDNHCNRMRKCADQPVTPDRLGSFGKNVLDVVMKLEAEGHKDLAVADERVAMVAAGIYAKECFRTEREAFRDYDQFQLDQSPTLPIPEDQMMESWTEIKFRKLIGSGTFGDVFAALFRGDVVAVKILSKPCLAKISKNDFAREVQALCRLDNRFIVRCIVGCALPETLKHFSVCMEYADMSLFEALHVRQVQITDECKHQYMTHLWLGLSYLHRESVVHGNITPNNVFLHSPDKKKAWERTAKLGDFGLAMMEARSGQPDQSAFVLKNVSARYAAPEVFQGRELSLQELMMADVYSLGLVCYELSTENRPYGNDVSEEDVLRVRSEGHKWPCKMGEAHHHHPGLENCWNRPDFRPSAYDMVGVLVDEPDAYCDFCEAFTIDPPESGEKWACS